VTGRHPTIATTIRAVANGQPPSPPPPPAPRTPSDTDTVRGPLRVIELHGVTCTHCAIPAHLLIIDPTVPTAPPLVVHRRGARIVSYCDGRVVYGPHEGHGLTRAMERFLVRAVFGRAIPSEELTDDQLDFITSLSTSRS
jgi:hypothetical protein